MDIITIVILSACFLLPFCVLMAAIAIASYQTKLASAIKYLKHYQTNQLGKQAKTRSSVSLNIFIFVAITIIGLLGCLIVVMLGRYLNISWYPL